MRAIDIRPMRAVCILLLFASADCAPTITQIPQRKNIESAKLELEKIVNTCTSDGICKPVPGPITSLCPDDVVRNDTIKERTPIEGECTALWLAITTYNIIYQEAQSKQLIAGIQTIDEAIRQRTSELNALHKSRIPCIAQGACVVPVEAPVCKRDKINMGPAFCESIWEARRALEILADANRKQWEAGLEIQPTAPLPTPSVTPKVFFPEFEMVNPLDLLNRPNRLYKGEQTPLHPPKAVVEAAKAMGDIQVRPQELHEEPFIPVARAAQARLFVKKFNTVGNSIGLFASLNGITGGAALWKRHQLLESYDLQDISLRSTQCIELSEVVRALNALGMDSTSGLETCKGGFVSSYGGSNVKRRGRSGSDCSRWRRINGNNVCVEE